MTPVYRTQCKTFAIAKAILGLPDGDIATRGDHPVLHLRIVAAHRCDFSKTLRKRVADAVRQTRKT